MTYLRATKYVSHWLLPHRVVHYCFVYYTLYRFNSDSIQIQFRFSSDSV
ncbi:hypothetical protein ACN38_g10449, partial [Penicillium nordicum]